MSARSAFDRPAAPFVAAAIGYTGLAILLTWPLVLRLDAVFLHDRADPALSAWILWWNAHHLPFTAGWWNGLAFFPTLGTLAFSDHRVGLSLLASPIQWLGGSPILAYNIVLLVTFVLSALAAHALGFALTRRHSAGLVAGLAFGFCPYRIAHISHLELLAGFWMPIELVALHRFVATDRPAWLVVFALAWWLQALSSGYYLFYFSVILVLWVAWFIRPGEWRRLRAIGLAWGVAGLAILPVLLRYRTILRGLGLSRGIDEIEFYSADITAVLNEAPSLPLWSMLRWPARPEGELFPGLFIVAIVLAGLVYSLLIARRSLLRPPSLLVAHRSLLRGSLLRTVLFVCAALAAAVALSVVALGPWRLGAGGLTLLSAARPEKPLSIALLFLALAVLSGPRFTVAFRDRSTFAFYTAAAGVAWMLSWGPSPRFLDRVVLYQAPYAWLMRLPGFRDGLRVPARFGMVMMLMLAVAGALALARLLANSPGPRRRLVTAIMAIGIVADGWMSGMPLAEAPPFWTAPSGVNLAEVAGVLELPLGDVDGDAAAVYRSVSHGRPVVNGLSGYFPPHYKILQRALEEHDPEALAALAEYGPLLIVIDRKADPDGAWGTYVSQFAGAGPIGSTGDRTFFVLPRRRGERSEQGPQLPIRDVIASRGALNVRDLHDGDRQTRWSSGAAQQGDEDVRFDVDDVQCLGAVTLSLGPYLGDFPRELIVETSIDGEIWRTAWQGRTAGLTTRAILEAPLDPILTLPLGSARARAVQLRQIGRDDVSPWSIAGLRVTGCPPMP